jgi:hypothetical protein
MADHVPRRLAHGKLDLFGPERLDVQIAQQMAKQVTAERDGLRFVREI